MAGYENEPVVIEPRCRRRSWCRPVTPITLKAGLAGYITQALGGSFTLYIEGNLYRMPGEQADAIGKEVVRAPELPPGATEEDVRELAWEQMRQLLRSGNSDQHRRPRPGLRAARVTPRPTARASSASA